ncbi:cilia- and flagella-associated protein 161 isoform X1 [Procambarus clarkii]|uniref:cilia- and flagella-associated protein 161 isoform X1 n=1 Tax=Procambarus clarkii TaxID=6728 RepID=UPI003742F6E1
MARNAYHSCVRVGNWYENRLMEEELRQSAKRSQNAERYFQELSAALLEEAEVSVCPDGLLHFGDTVIIHAPVVQPHKGAPRPSLACSVSVTPSRQALLRNYYHDAPLTASPAHHQPVVKNVFTILPRRSCHAPGSVLCYGDPFDLTHTAASRERLYVTSPVGSALHSGRESRRQEVLLKAESSAHSAWRLQPSDPELRLTYEGQPAEVGARVQMIQTMTNQPLVIEEEFSTNTIFGQEQEVSVGVVSRATTRAASTVALLTWTRRTSQQETTEGEQEHQQEAQQEEGKEEEAQQEEEEEERNVEERMEGLRLVLEDDDDDASQGDGEAR